MKEIRVLVVDDSPFARELIMEILSTDKEIRVVGEAANGMEATQKVRDLKPDIVTIDIEMPVMNGIDAIEEIMAANAVPILVVTTRGDSKTAYDAISRGALDLVVKPDVSREGAREFIDKIKLLSGIKVITHIRRRIMREVKLTEKLSFGGGETDRVVAIAASTGGPEALSIILSSLPAGFPCPVVIAQHISDGFVPGMTEWLRKLSKLSVKSPAEGEPLLPGTVYIAPSEKNMEITDAKTITLAERQEKDIYHPSCDRLLFSAARVFGSRTIGVILTGMGSDGARGMEKIRKAGGITIAQDEKTSIVFGMPKIAIESGCIDRVLPIEEISGEIVRIMTGSAAALNKR